MIYKPTTMQKQPASLTMIVKQKMIVEDKWWKTMNCFPHLCRVCCSREDQDVMYGVNVDWFTFEVVYNLRMYTNYDSDIRESVCEEANTWDTLLDNEQDKMWFFFLNKLVNHNILGITIPVSIHQYEYLYKMRFFGKMLKVNNSAELSELLLMLSGDVESNPGPTYKDVCKLDYIKNKHERKIYKDKNMRRMNLELKPRKNRDFDYLKEEIKIAQGEMQIGGLISNAAQMLTGAYMTHKTNKLMNKMDANIDMISTQLSQTLTQFRGVFEKTQSMFFKGLDVISLIGDIVFGLIQVSFAQANKKIYSLGIEIFRILTKHNLDINIIDTIKTNTNTLFTKIKGTMQISDTIQQLEYITPLHVCMFLLSILSVIFTGVAPKTTSVETLLKRLGDNARNCKNLVDFNNATHNGMTFVLNEIKKSLGIRPSDEIEQFVVGIGNWFDEVRALLTRAEEWKKSDQILKDPAVVMEVENLYKKGLDYSRDIADKKLQRDLTMPFHVHMKLLTELMKQVDTSGAFGTKPRTQPVVIWLFGESGVGKSGMSWPLAIDLNNIFVHNAQEAKEFSKHIYMRNVEQEFWDNYQGQNVVIYDDFGQRVDSQQAPNEEFMELIRTANIAPYPLHMAHLEDKRKTRFTSKILLMTSNVFEQNVSSLTFPDAFRRRIDLCAKITNIEEFTKAGYSNKTGKNVRRLDKKKVQEHFGEVISTSVYNIDLVCPESGKVLESNLTYEEFLEKASDRTRDAFDSSRKMNEFLEKYAEQRYNGITKAESRAEETFEDAVDKIPGEMQVNNLELLKNADLNTLINLAEQNQLFSKNGEHLTVENITTDKFDEYYSLSLSEDFEVWSIASLRATCYKKIGGVYDRLLRMKNDVMKKFSEWKDKTINWIKEHPFTIVSTILGTLITILTVCHFWSKFFSTPKEINKLAEVTHKNITIKLYKNQDGVDVREFNQAGILSIIPKIINGVAFNATKSLIMNTPYPMVLDMLSQLGVHATIYSVNKIINMRGRKLELSDNEVALRPVREAKCSADPTTIHRVKQVLEARASADPTTLQKSRQVLEARASADSTTLHKNKQVLEANVSADPTTLSRKGRMLEGPEEKIPADMQVWKDQTAQNLITNRIFSNMYKICRVINKEESSPLLHGLFVRGTVMVVPSHLSEFLSDEDEVELVNSFNVTFTLPWKEVKQIRITNAIGQEKEAMVLVFPNYVAQHADIVKHFSNAESMQQYKRADVCLPLLRYSEKMKRMLMYILGNTEACASDKIVVIEDYAKGKDYTIRESLVYNLPTKSGDCGAPLIVNENKVLRKIAGIHVAGDVTGMAYSESITQKDLERAMMKIPAEMQIKLDLDNTIKLHNVELPFNQDIDPISMNLIPGQKFNGLGKVVPIYDAGKSELRKSLLYGKIAEITTKPAKLKNYIENSEVVNIKHKNLGKAAMDTPFVNKNLLDEATLLVKQKWLKNIRPELRRILTYEEAIKGNDFSEYISPINRRSSPGYPWCLERRSGMPGKTGWFGNDMEYILDPKVEQAVKFRIEQASRGVRTPTMWVDTLKDERRPIAKVDAGKTRVFSNGPMDFSIAFRQYFLGFVAHLMENRITNEVSIGTNVYSRDWTKTAKKMQEKGFKVFAGDFSTFDGTLNSSMMFRFLDVVNEFYDDGPINALIRYVLFSEIVNSVHICNDLVYYMTHSQPSGNPVTTPLNCFINSVGGRMCFDIAAKQQEVDYDIYDFDKHVSLVSFGDDNIYNVSDEVSSWFNMHTITDAFLQIGMIYTDETKDVTKIPPKYKTLEEVSYLKRGFVPTKTGRWLAPLDINTILEMPNWCRGSLDVQEGTKVNCENAMMELAMHPEEVYDKWTRVINSAYRNVTGDMLEYKSYRGYHLEWLEDYFM